MKVFKIFEINSLANLVDSTDDRQNILVSNILNVSMCKDSEM